MRNSNKLAQFHNCSEFRHRSGLDAATRCNNAMDIRNRFRARPACSSYAAHGFTMDAIERPPTPLSRSDTARARRVPPAGPPDSGPCGAPAPSTRRCRRHAEVVGRGPSRSARGFACRSRGRTFPAGTGTVRRRSRRNGATRRRCAGPMSGGPVLRKTAAGTGTDPKTAFAWRHGPAGVVEAEGRCFPLSSGAGGGTRPGSRGREACGRKGAGYRWEKCVSPPPWTAGKGVPGARPPRIAGRNGRSNAGLRGGRGGGTPRIQTVNGPTGPPGAGCRGPTAWRRNILAIAWGFPDTAARTGVLSRGRGPGGPARPPVRAGVGGRGAFRPVPPSDRPFPAISPPSGASADPAERRGSGTGRRNAAIVELSQ